MQKHLVLDQNALIVFRGHKSLILEYCSANAITYGESRLWDDKGTMVASITQKLILGLWRDLKLSLQINYRIDSDNFLWAYLRSSL